MRDASIMANSSNDKKEHWAPSEFKGQTEFKDNRADKLQS